MQKVTFYTKLDCPLCDKAYQILLEVALDSPLRIEVVDITHSPSTIKEKYATRVPVIARPNSDTELGWPFTGEELEAYLHA